MVDLIDRSMAIDAVSDGILREEEEPLVECVAECNSMIEWAVETLKKLPSAEQLTDNEKRIFLAAMAREEKVCKEVDDKYGEPHEVSLVSVCHKITRKVKAALWGKIATERGTQ